MSYARCHHLRPIGGTNRATIDRFFSICASRSCHGAVVLIASDDSKADIVECVEFIIACANNSAIFVVARRSVIRVIARKTTGEAARSYICKFAFVRVRRVVPEARTRRVRRVSAICSKLTIREDRELRNYLNYLERLAIETVPSLLRGSYYTQPLFWR